MKFYPTHRKSLLALVALHLMTASSIAAHAVTVSVEDAPTYRTLRTDFEDANDGGALGHFAASLGYAATARGGWLDSNIPESAAYSTYTIFGMTELNGGCFNPSCAYGIPTAIDAYMNVDVSIDELTTIELAYLIEGAGDFEFRFAIQGAEFAFEVNNFDGGEVPMQDLLTWVAPPGDYSFSFFIDAFGPDSFSAADFALRIGAPVPIPPAIALFASGIAGMVVVGRRRKRGRSQQTREDR